MATPWQFLSKLIASPFLAARWADSQDKSLNSIHGFICSESGRDFVEITAAERVETLQRDGVSGSALFLN